MLLWALAQDGSVDRMDGIMLLVGFVVFLVIVLRSPREDQLQLRQELDAAIPEGPSTWVSLVMVIGGLVGLVLGGRLIVHAAVAMAHVLGVSELVIGMTVVALGTSLPELATSIVGAVRGHADLILGNVLGSNVFNLLLVMGVVAQIQPLPVYPQSLRFDLPMMIAFACVLMPIMLSGLRISRWEGGVLFTAYIAFIAWQTMGNAAGG